MIPILYEKTETEFKSNGIGRLTDCTRCIVTEERNGIYECEFDYPITGNRYDDIQEGRIIAVTHDEEGDIQPFDIYHRTAPINGIVTFYAHHICYRQSGITVKPFTASGISAALQGLKSNSFGSNPFAYWTDKTTEGTYKLDVPRSLKACLAGEQGSILDVFGTGEYKYDKFTTRLYLHRGSDTTVEIRYGKNLSDITHDIDYIDSYNGIVPYWYGPDISVDDSAEDAEEVYKLVTLPEWAIYSDGQPYDGRDTTYPLDLTNSFEEPPTAAQLRAAAKAELDGSSAWLAKENIQVSFAQLWQTEEYKDVAPLQKVKLCDTVNVIYPELGVSKTKVKVIKVVYNTLLDRYDEIELGDSLASYAALITSGTQDQIAQLESGLVIVSEAANKALNDADTAHKAAIDAEASASDAAQAAADAQKSADDAALEAGRAKLSAESAHELANEAAKAAVDAQNDAYTANNAANGALTQLSVVEDVVGVLNWIQEHGKYELTNDTVNDPGKHYYIRTGSGTSSDPYRYEITLGPVADYYILDQSGNNILDQDGNYLIGKAPAETWNPKSRGCYELTSTDEAVADYVSSHLALTEEGLYVIKDNSGYKILLANDGMKVYDATGVLVATYGESISFSSSRAQYIGGENAYIIFDPVTGSLHIGGSQVTVGGGETLSEMLEQIAAAVENVEVQYAVGNDSTHVPTSGWSSETPVWQTGKYIWQRTAVTKNGTVYYSNETCIQGAKGDTGATGATGPQGPKGEKGDSVTVTKSGDTVTITDGDGHTVTVKDGANGQSIKGDDGEDAYLHIAWATAADGSTGFSTTDATGKTYIGTYTDHIEADSTDRTKYKWAKIKGEQGDKGDKGDTGVGISNVTEYYALNNSTAAPADSAFSTGVKTPTASNRYLWNYEVITYTNSTTKALAKHIVAVYGETGDTGKGIASITEYYALSATTSAPADSAFSTGVKTVTATNKYLWNYEVITYTDSSVVNTAKRIIGTYGDKGDKGEQGDKGDAGEILTVTRAISGSNVIYTAHLYINDAEVTLSGSSVYTAQDFEWYREYPDRQEFIGYGYTLTLPAETYEEDILLTWTRREYRYLLDGSGNHILDGNGNRILVRTEV